MDSELQLSNPPTEPEYTVPWEPVDNWIVIFLLIVLDILLLLAAYFKIGVDIFQNAGLILIQLAYLLPVLLVFTYRRVNPRVIGFGKFDAASFGIGSGLLIVAYMIIIFHNLVLMLLGVNTQGEEVLNAFNGLDTPLWFIVVGVLFAPLVEEIVFRGFLFQGFRKRYGWIKGGILSSLIFGAAHLDPVAFIPTSVLGLVLTYTYHRTNSIWPGFLLHLMVNAFAFCSILATIKLGGLTP